MRSHAYHTLLTAGLLLLVSGCAADSEKDSGAWQATGSMNSARFNHRATLLSDGSVLVTGGVVNTPAFASGTAIIGTAERYDPRLGTWSDVSSMNDPRDEHTATLLRDGRVLVTGGFTNPTTGSSPITLGTAEVHDPATGLWRTTDSRSFGRDGYTTTLLLDGRVLLAGGFYSADFDSGYPPPDTDIYDPASDTWKGARSLVDARKHHTETLLPNGQVLVTGGWNKVKKIDYHPGLERSDPFTLKTAEIYVPDLDYWRPVAAMLSYRAEHTATLLPNGKILITGGVTTMTDRVLDTPRTLATVELYDPVSNTWTHAASMASPRRGHSAVLLPNKRVFVSGGGQEAEIYDPDSNSWKSAGTMKVTGFAQTATLLPNGKVLVTGGVNSRNHWTPTAELYTP